jgi:amidase
MAGPDEIMSRGYTLNLPEWHGRSLGELRVAVWKNDEVAPVSQEVEQRVDLVATALRDAGAAIDESARPEFSGQHSHDTYQDLLHATMASRMPEGDYEGLKALVAELDPDDDSQDARVRRAQVSSFKSWSAANELRHHLRWHWHEFFKQHDVLIAPIMATAAIPHDHGKFGERTIMVDNQQRPYFEQVYWAGLTGVAYLPSTVIPTGLNAEGLPIGIQIVGREYDDLITIGVAQELEAMGFAFTPPTAYP